MLEVRTPGLLSTVQDGLGRPGVAALGVPRGGAADPWGLAVANLVLGNVVDEAAIEMTITGPALVALTGSLVGLGGADLGATILPAGEHLRPGSARRLEQGWSIEFRDDQRDVSTGARSYLALPGGVDVPSVLGSASTCLPGRFGGFEGRALRAGDRFRGRWEHPAVGETAWAGATALADFGRPVRVRLVRGPHAGDRLLEALVERDWHVSATSDRMGVRLEGDPIDAPNAAELVSLPMVWGAVQLPPSGEPIVLLVDAPTVGGYPVVAVVISADRPLVGQLGPGARIRFDLVSIREARAARANLDRELRDALSRTAADAAWEQMTSLAGAWPERIREPGPRIGS